MQWIFHSVHDFFVDVYPIDFFAIFVKTIFQIQNATSAVLSRSIKCLRERMDSAVILVQQQQNDTAFKASLKIAHEQSPPNARHPRPLQA